MAYLVDFSTERKESSGLLLYFDALYIFFSHLNTCMATTQPGYIQ